MYSVCTVDFIQTVSGHCNVHAVAIVADSELAGSFIPSGNLIFKGFILVDFNSAIMDSAQHECKEVLISKKATPFFSALP